MRRSGFEPEYPPDHTINRLKRLDCLARWCRRPLDQRRLSVYIEWVGK